MKIGLIVTGIFNPAVFLSVSRGVAALALFYFVANEEWFWSLLIFGWAVVSDMFDGEFAEIWPHPWNGKLMNDIPSGILSFAAPGSILLWLFLKHPDAGSSWHSSWFWAWIGASVIFGMGTLVFNSLKNPNRLPGNPGAEHQRVLDSMVRAEVAQGWFYGLYMFAFGAQFWYMFVIETYGSRGNNLTTWLIFCWLSFLTASHARERFSDRPEVRTKHAFGD